MMGHREQLKSGWEWDLAGFPGRRWRDKMKARRPGLWRYWKNRINRRCRHEVKLVIKHCIN
jgi:hypothetical protein